MKTQNKTLAMVVGCTLAASLTVSPVLNAAENPFALKSLTNGYQVAEHDGKAMEGKCGEGKCGANKKKADDKAKDGSCGSEKGKDGNCGSKS